MDGVYGILLKVITSPVVNYSNSGADYKVAWKLQGG